MSSSLTNCMLNFVPTPTTVKRRPPRVICWPTAVSPPKSFCLSSKPRTQTAALVRTSVSPMKRPSLVLRLLMVTNSEVMPQRSTRRVTVPAVTTARFSPTGATSLMSVLPSNQRASSVRRPRERYCLARWIGSVGWRVHIVSTPSGATAVTPAGGGGGGGGAGGGCVGGGGGGGGGGGFRHRQHAVEAEVVDAVPHRALD